MTGEGSTNPKRSDLPTSARPSEEGASPRWSAGWSTRKRSGEDMAVLAAPTPEELPFYFPGKVTTRTQYVSEHAAHLLAPRRGRQELHRAYRIVASVGEPGEYWGVQGMTWRNPPILADPDRIRKAANGRELLLFYDGVQAAPGRLDAPRAAPTT